MAFRLYDYFETHRGSNYALLGIVYYFVRQGNPVQQQILIAGCGDIGKRVAGLWIEQGHEVSALTRNVHRFEQQCDLRIRSIEGDLDLPDSHISLPSRDAWIFYFLPPPDNGEDDTRMRAFISHLDHNQPPEKIIYISTTGVYGDCHGEWVTEQSPVNPQSQRSKRRLAAEKILTEWHTRTLIPVIILRVAGIYGPGRLPIARIKSGQAVLDEKEAPFSNRIHSDDLARICVTAARQVVNGYHIYNVSDGNPTTMTDYFNRVAKIAGLQPPRTVTLDQAAQEFSPMMLSFLNESKRVDNRKMLQELGVELLYPDLETGLQQCLSGQ